MIQVIPIHNEKYNCIENILVSLAAYLGCDCFMMSQEAWGFNYNLEPPDKGDTICIGDKIHSNTGDYFVLLQQYHDISYIIHDSRTNNIDGFRQIIEGEMKEGYPVVLMIDLYWCPWTRFYKVYHAFHYCMVLESNKEKQAYCCMDPLYVQEPVWLPYYNFKQGILSCITLRRVVNEKVIDWKEAVRNGVMHYCGGESAEKTFDKMLSFARDVETSYDPYREFEEKNGIRISKLCNEINYIRLARLSFSNFLIELAKRYQNDSLKNHAKSMDEIANVWYNINILFIKSSFLEENERIRKRIAKEIRHVAQMEKELAETLLELTDEDLDWQETEERITAIWKEVLKKENIGRKDNFFQLGGDSFLLVQVHNQLEEMWPGKTEVTDLFAYPTVSKLTEYILHTSSNQQMDSEVRLHQYFSKIGLEVTRQLKEITKKRELHRSSIFIAAYMYLVHQISSQERIWVFYVMDSGFMICLTVNLGEIATLNDLIAIVQKKLCEGDFIEHAIVDWEGEGHKICYVFNEYSGILPIPDTERNLIISLAEKGNEYHLKIQLKNLDEGMVKDMFKTYIKVIHYIIQNQ